jgi:endoglucanase
MSSLDVIYHPVTPMSLSPGQEVDFQADLSPIPPLSAPAWAGYSKGGVFRPGTGTWYLRNANSPSCCADISFSWAGPGDIPVAGDWNNDGFASAGVLRPGTGTWYLVNTNAAHGVADYTFHMPVSPVADPNDQPVIGDWDGDGKTDIGLFRPDDRSWNGSPIGTMYLQTCPLGIAATGCTGAVTKFQFAVAGDVPVAGDWTGSGRWTVGVYRPSTGTWYIGATANGTGNTCCLAAFQFGVANPSNPDKPITGDWAGWGRTWVGVFRPGEGTWHLAYGNGTAGGGGFTSGPLDYLGFQFASPGDLPVAGKCWQGATC